tara:strand:+ start:646 stop:1443 length:798 start_codon:yes stop_codon:yes gene_type:complete
MSWLSKWIKNRSGENQKVDLAAQQTRFDDAMQPTNDRYDDLYKMGQQDTQIDSTNNQAVAAQMQTVAADNSAEASRLAERQIAMGGGGNATATAFNVADQANKASAAASEGFNNYYQNARAGGMETMAGVTANQANIANNRFNMYESGMAANKAIDSQASKWKANLLMGGAKVAGNLMMGNPMGALSAGGQMMSAQEGGLITRAYQGGDYVEGEEFIPVGNGMSDEQAQITGMLGYAMGGEVQDVSPNQPNKFNIPTRLGGQIIE